MSASGTAAGLGLMSATSWGGSDFVGGLGARRAPTLLIVISGHFISLLVLLAVCLGAHLRTPNRHDLVFAALGGFEGALSLAVFYRALAMAPMGLTAALTGLLTALLPVLFSVYQDGLPPLQSAAGLAIGLVSIWMITHTRSAKDPSPPAAQNSVPHPFRASHEMRGKPQLLASPPPRSPETEAKSTTSTPLLLGALAGLGFGTQLILFKLVAGGGVLWAMTSARAAGVAAMLLILVIFPPRVPWRGFWLFGVLAGSLDTLGNLLYIETTRFGRLAEAALVSSLYPAVTILLAALVLRERPTLRQFSGMALALAAVALLSL